MATDRTSDATADAAKAAPQASADRLAIAGSGAIACGLAATAAHHGPVLLLARSEGSAQRARRDVERSLRRAQAVVDRDHVRVVTDIGALARCTFVVEADRKSVV